MAQPEVQNGVEAEKAGAGTEAVVKFSALKPQLLVEAPKAKDAVLFYKAAFGAEELGRTLHPKRKADQELPLILSAQLNIAGSTVLVSDLADPTETPSKSEGSGIVLWLETDDVEGGVSKAVSAGGVAVGEIAEGEGGERVGKVKDPYGLVWSICSPPKKCIDVDA
jgi:uncharacterized glyoxalase superfamily protein PhnB